MSSIIGLDLRRSVTVIHAKFRLEGDPPKLSSSPASINHAEVTHNVSLCQ